MAAISCTVITTGGGDYTSLSAAEAGMQATYANLVGDGNTITFNCSGTVDANAVTIDGWTTNATYFITVNVAKANRHTGARATGYRLEAVFNNLIPFTSRVDYIIIDGLAIIVDGDGGAAACTTVSPHVIFKNCLFVGHGYSSNFVMRTGVSGGIYTFANCIIYRQGNLFSWAYGSHTMHIYNCTILNSVSDGLNFYVDSGNTLVAKNCYVGGSSTADYANLDYGTITTCHSSDATGNTQTSVADCHFTNSTAGSENIHIDGTSALVGAGTDLHADATYPFSTDFEDDARPDGAWDVGADEYAAEGGGAASGPLVGQSALVGGGVLCGPGNLVN